MVENDAVNITAYVRIYKDPTGVLWHNFNNYDSKKETGMVGLKNQGATCYLNSLLQSLFFTNAFRKAVYQIPTKQEADKSNSAWALQRLFHQLQSSESAVSTNELTLSFGWETRHIFEQQDVQELSRILMERMEERMKGTDAENALAKMFVGKMKTYISCINVKYVSERIEDFWDIQLNVSGNRNLDESFKDYIQVETMDGDNKYFAEGFGLQDAKKGVIFESFPQVLHLQLKRFEYDINRDTMMKVNDRYEFPEVFDASPYLSESADRSEPWLYQLHGVLVHSGDIAAGHYYAYLKPTKDGHFYRFDDDRVTRATLKEALEENFGGDYTNLTNGTTGMRNPYTRTLSTKRSMSAYMLVYIRQSRLDSILQPVSEEDTPKHIATQLSEEKALLDRKRKEREEQHLYLSCGVLTNDEFRAHQGFDLGVWENDPNNPCAPTYYRLLRVSTVEEFCQTLAASKNVPSDHVRLWVMVNRQNKTFRPDQPILDRSLTIEEALTKYTGRDKSWRLWLEVANTVEEGKSIWPETQLQTNNNVPYLVFLKYFDVEAQTLHGVGHIYVRKFAKVSEMLPTICQMMGWSTSSPPPIALYEEIKHSMIEQMKPKMTFQQAEIQDGDIICFQKDISDSEANSIRQAGKYANAKEFYDYLLNRVSIRLIPRYAQNSTDHFDLVLNRKLSYDQFAAKVAESLKVDPTHIRFTTVNASTSKPKMVVKRNPNQNLHQILNPQYVSYNLNQRNDSLFFEVLEMSLSELEMKKAIKLTWVTEGLTKEETYELLVPKNGVVADLFSELKRKANLDDDTIKDVRLYTTINSKLTKELGPDYPVTSILDHQPLIAQRLSKDELEAVEGSRLIHAFHFDKEPSRTHGIPFVFRIKPVSQVFTVDVISNCIRMKH
jgi:ubiquitin carboxyl-terminal hydrolase 7